MRVYIFNIIKSFIFISLLIYLVYIYFFSGFHMFVNKNTEYDLVIPSSLSDIKLFFRHKIYYEKYINYSNIVLIGESNINNLIVKDNSISFICEDSLVQKKK